MHLKLVSSTNEFFIKSAAPACQAQQERFKVAIIKKVLTILTIELIGDAALGRIQRPVTL